MHKQPVNTITTYWTFRQRVKRPLNRKRITYIFKPEIKTIIRKQKIYTTFIEESQIKTPQFKYTPQKTTCLPKSKIPRVT